MMSLSVREKNLLIIAACLVLTTVIYLYGIQPLWVGYSQEKSELSDVTAKAQQLKEYAKVNTQEEMSSIDSQKKLLEMKVPSQLQTAELLYYIQNLATANKVTLVGDTFSPEEQSQDAAVGANSGPRKLVQNVVVQGSYEGIKGFIASMEKMGKDARNPRMTWVQEGEIRKLEQPAGVLVGSFQIIAFYTPDKTTYVNEVVPKMASQGKVNPF